MYKFGTVHRWSQAPHVYPNVWERQRTKGPDRLVIAPSADHVGLMLRLAETWRASGYFVLYVLILSRIGKDEGRYECPHALTFDELVAFVGQYGSFLESDGRHHFWIGSVDGQGTLVYDNHNVIYAYGSVDEYIDVLNVQGLTEAPVRFPNPHLPNYHPQNDVSEEAIVAHWAWRRLPLQPEDER